MKCYLYEKRGGGGGKSFSHTEEGGGSTKNVPYLEGGGGAQKVPDTRFSHFVATPSP